MTLDPIISQTSNPPSARAPTATRLPMGDSVAGAQAAMFMRVLDEIDYGLLLVDVDGRLHHANQLALHHVGGEGPLQLAGGRLDMREPTDRHALHRVLADAERGRRRLFVMNDRGVSVSIALIPMAWAADDPGPRLILLVFGKRCSTQTLTMDFYAGAHGLTATEAVILKCICSGMKPKEIARAQSVAISTVRSQICSVRAKTQTDSIHDLINRVAVLPPITPLLKTVGLQAPVAVH